MQDHNKTKEQLIEELVILRQRFAELEAVAYDCKITETNLQAVQVQLRQEVESQTLALQTANAQLLAEIAGRDQAEAALLAAKEQLEAILEAVPGIVSWISSDLCYLGVNRRLAKTFGLPPNAFVGQDIGFLSSSNEFNDFVREFFSSPAQDAYREVTAMVNGVSCTFLIVVQKYDNDRAIFAVGIDISERHRAEEALRQAEAKYRSIFENAVEGIFQTTLDGRYISANPTLARIYGYDSPEDLLANLTNVQQQLYVEPDRRTQFVESLNAHGSLLAFESQVYHKDGSLIWISENACIVCDDDGNLLYYEGTVEDISERKRAEEAFQRVTEELEIRVEERTVALKELNRRLMLEISERQRAEIAMRSSEAELRALFAAMTDIITVFDGQGRYLKMVATNSQQLYKPEIERLGKTVYEVLPPSQAMLFVSYIQRALNKGKTVSLEYSLPVSHPEESNLAHEEAWFAANVSPMPDNCVIWVARNITNRKQAEEALRLSEAKEREKSQQLAQTLQELQQTQAQLVQSEKMSSLGLLVAGVAHEINNPVNFIYGNLVYATRYTEDLLDLLQHYQQVIPDPDSALKEKIETVDLEFLKVDLQKLMTSMHVGAERIREIVRSLQSFSRIDGAELKIVDLHEGIDSSLMILHHRLNLESATAIAIVKEYGDLPPVRCYAGQLNQVFMNVLTNAIDAIESRYANNPLNSHLNGSDNGLEADQPEIASPLICIQTRLIKGDITSESLGNSLTEMQCDRVAIHIKDNGMGMSITVQQRVFDPFFTTKPVGKGTGLGMSISHQIIVERHGGQIRCFSDPGVGTEFVIEVPLQPAHVKGFLAPALQSAS
jgi:PAS domain S-box-containing protein